MTEPGSQVGLGTVGLCLGELLAALEEDLRHPSGASSPQALEPLFHRWCAVEQLLADSKSLPHVMKRWRSVAVDLAGACFGLLDKPSWAPRARACLVAAIAGIEGSQPPGSGTSSGQLLAAAAPAECLTSWPVDLAAYASVIGESLAAMPVAASAVVVGIRTSGSYLGPICAAALLSRASQVSFTTVRPVKDQSGAIPDSVTRLLRSGPASPAPTMFVVDDGVETGATAGVVHGWADALGIVREEIVHIINQQIRLNGVPHPVRNWWSSSARLLCASRAIPACPGSSSPAMEFFSKALTSPVPGYGSIRIERVEAAPLSYWQRFLAAYLPVSPPDVLAFDLRRRKRRYLLHAAIDDVPLLLIAKYIGYSLFAEAERRRFALLAGMGPRLVTVRQGFLIYEWLPGQPLQPFSGLNPGADTEAIALYTAKAGKCSVAGVRPVTDVRDQALSAVERLCERYPGIDVEAARARVRTNPATGDVAISRLPRNQGYWHHLRTPGGDLARLHLDVSDWPRDCDIAEELAAVAFELNVSCDAVSHLIANYKEASGDEGADGRFDLTMPIYLSRVQRDFDEYEMKTAGFGPSPLPGNEEVLEPYVRRKEQIAIAFESWARGEFGTRSAGRTGHEPGGARPYSPEVGDGA